MIKMCTKGVCAVGLVVLSLVLQTVSLSAQITFQRKISPNFLNSFGMDMKQAADSGYIILGNNRGSSSSESIILHKTDKWGEVKWSKAYAHPDPTTTTIEGSAIQVTSDGYIIVGTAVTGSVSNFDANAFIMKMDANGTLQWKKEIGGTKSDYAYSVEPTIDGGYIVSGATASYGSAGIDSSSQGSSDQYAYDLWLIKLNNAGVTEWSRTYGKKSTKEYGWSVKQTLDKGYIMAGTARVSTNANVPWTRGVLVKTDSSGIQQWIRYIGDSIGIASYNSFSSVELTPDSGFIISGTSHQRVQPWLVKTDKLGNVIWNKVYYTEPHYITQSGTHKSLAVHLTNDGGYVLGVTRNSPPYAYYYLLKTDIEGKLLWSKKYGDGESGLSLRAMVTDIEGGYALVGCKPDSYGNGTEPGYVYVVKTDLAGNVAGCDVLAPVPDVLSPVVYSTPVVFPSSFTNGSTRDVNAMVSDYVPISTSFCFPVKVTAKSYAYNLCLGDSAGFTNQSNAPLCQWNFGDTSSGTSNTSSLFFPKHLFTDTGTYTISLIVTDGNGSTDTLEYTTIIRNNNFLSVSQNDTICKGNSSLLTASGAIAWYSWRPGGTLSDSLIANPVASPGSSTTYTVIGYNTFCFDTLTVTVIIDSLDAIITGNTAICSGDSTVLTASGGGVYMWSTGDINSFVTVNPLGDSAYWVAVSRSGCSDTVVKNITVFANPVVDAGENITISYGNSTLLSTTGIGDYEWTPPEGLNCTNCLSPTATPSLAVTYYVSVTDANACKNSDSVMVFVDLPCGDVFVPSVFSPNVDGNNDMLFVRGRCIQSMEFKIYDRWGEKIFETTGTTRGWDGTYKDKPMNDGVFVYYLDAVLENGALINKKGQILLLR